MCPAVYESKQAIVGRIDANMTPRPAGRPRVPVDPNEVVRLRQQRLSWRQIAQKLHAGATTVRRAYHVALICQTSAEANQ